jgi:hypothetical protein
MYAPIKVSQSTQTEPTSDIYMIIPRLVQSYDPCSHTQYVTVIDNTI